MVPFIIRLITKDESFASAASSAGFTCDVQDVQDVQERANTAFVSPANSFGFMDGGIDAAYMRMFPGCQTAVQSKIRQLGRLTQLGRPYLPVGCALWIPVQDATMLISAPTMFLPHAVTRNAYWAMLAILVAMERIVNETPTIQTVIIPSLCCGWGKMAPEEAVRQMRTAVDDFIARRLPPETEHRPGFVLFPSRDAEQPL